MRNPMRFLALLLLVSVVSTGSPAWAQNEGQAELDEATELRLSARTPADLQKVAALCETALKKGLSEDDTKFAKQMGAGAMFELGSRLASMVLDEEEPPQNWRFFRHTGLQSLNKALEFDDQLGEAHLLIGRLQALPNGKREEAVAAADKAVELLKKSNKREQLAEAYVLRAGLSEKPEDQLADYRQAFEIDKSNSAALEGQALVLLRQGKSDEALGLFDKLLESAEEKTRIRLTIAEALMGMDRFDDAMKQANKAIEEDARSSTAHTLRARLFALQEDANAAIADLDKALELDPQNFRALILRCNLHMVESNFDKARKDVRTMLAANPRLALPYELRSQIASSEAAQAKEDGKKTMARMKFSEAARDMRLLLQNDPNNHRWRLQLAAIYSSDDQPRRAIREISKILIKDEDNWTAYRSRGDAYLSIGEHQKAVGDYEAALKLSPKNSGVLNNLAWVLSTSPKDEVRDGKRAIELARMACEETQYEAAHILSTLASAYAEIGDFETARKWAKKAVDAGAEDLKDQLQEELDAYKEEKPWRELQETKENPDFEKPSGNVIDT